MIDQEERLIKLSEEYNFYFDLQNIKVLYKIQDGNIQNGEYYNLIVYLESEILKFQEIILEEILDELENKLIKKKE